MNHSNEYMINMVTTPADGKCGIGTYTSYLINDLKNRDIKVRLVQLELNCNNTVYFIKKAFESANDCNIVHIQFEYHIFGNKFNLVGIFSLLFYSILKVLSYFHRFKIVTTMHEIYEPSKIRSIIIGFPKKLDRSAIYALYALLRHFIIIYTSDRIIVLSELNKKKLARSGVNSEKIAIISHGTDAPKFLNREKCKNYLGINSNTKVITIFGMISHHKGHDIFVKVAKELFDSKVVFLIAGEAKSDQDKIFLDSIKKNAPQNTLFYGFVPQEKIPELFNATDIMILPYRDGEVSGVLELSMSYRIPTITSNLPSFNKIKEQYECILLFEKNNTDSLKKEIRKLLDDKQLQMKLENNARTYTDENSVLKAIEKTLPIYKGLI
jgi:glycosyltransferase involved in cell wall biosynthesis